MVANRRRHGQQRTRPRTCSRFAASADVWEPDRVTALLLAHQGGWDEILFVAVPIAIFGGLLAVANRRASRVEQQQDPPRGDETP
jgi:hypothetical protein